MTLTKWQRQRLFDRYRGHCAYCGGELGRRWHADHVMAVGRHTRWVPAGFDPETNQWKPGRFVPLGTMSYPERDCFANMQPACHLCNIDKSNLSLEHWRATLQRKCEVLRGNYSAYRHALRFGLVQETGRVIRFHFEVTEPSVPRRPLTKRKAK